MSEKLCPKCKGVLIPGILDADIRFITEYPIKELIDKNLIDTTKKPFQIDDQFRLKLKPPSYICSKCGYIEIYGETLAEAFRYHLLTHGEDHGPNYPFPPYRE